MRILMMAPYERGLDHGGSQRATAMAERLEDRGAQVEWQVFRSSPTSWFTKLRSDLALRPALIGIYPYGEPQPRGRFDVVISSHSYLAHHLARFPSDAVRMVDFHNLEWRQLADNASFVRGLRALHPRLQIHLMRRFERRVTFECDLATFVSDEELAWARSSAPDAELVLLPSVLPRDAERQAAALTQSPGSRREPRLLYIGTVKFPPNLRALVNFLRDTWPVMRRAVPDLKLTIAGRCRDQDRQLLASFPGVEALGFVEDVAPLLRESIAVIMPIEGWAGTSLRALYCALAGIWVIGTPAAFRGVPWEMGAVVESPEQWAEAVREALDGRPDSKSRIEQARAAVLELQRDPQPWDHLMDRLTTLSRQAA